MGITGCIIIQQEESIRLIFWHDESLVTCSTFSTENNGKFETANSVNVVKTLSKSLPLVNA